MNKEVEIIESIASKIRYQDKIWIPENAKNIKKELDSISSAKIRCWLRFKNIEEFELDDIRKAFPEWKNYAISQIIYKINPLVKDKTIQQLNASRFKVLRT